MLVVNGDVFFNGLHLPRYRIYTSLVYCTLEGCVVQLNGYVFAEVVIDWDTYGLFWLHFVLSETFFSLSLSKVA